MNIAQGDPLDLVLRVLEGVRNGPMDGATFDLLSAEGSASLVLPIVTHLRRVPIKDAEGWGHFGVEASGKWTVTERGMEPRPATLEDMRRTVGRARRGREPAPDGVLGCLISHLVCRHRLPGSAKEACNRCLMVSRGACTLNGIATEALSRPSGGS
jgi:hypothetical protein